jgi:hypothetical protein
LIDKNFLSCKDAGQNPLWPNLCDFAGASSADNLWPVAILLMRQCAQGAKKDLPTLQTWVML